MNDIPRIVGLWSPAPQSGKSTAAAALIAANTDALRVSFAQPLREICEAIGKACGVGAATMRSHMNDGDLKEVPIPGIGKTFVELAIKMGTEVGREWIGEDIWADSFARRVEIALHVNDADFVVSDDMRFPNEAQRIRELGGILIGIVRPGATVSAARAAAEGKLSEADMDAVVLNDGTVEDLQKAVVKAANRLGAPV